MTRIKIDNLQIHPLLFNFVQDEVLPGTGIESDTLWQGFSAMVDDLAGRNAGLLAKREDLQAKIDAWHIEHRDNLDTGAYREFLSKIGYLQPEPDNFDIAPGNIDPEIADVAGPQLVVPVNNARYALNAANARWGSLYDALYGTDVISEENGQTKGSAFNPTRGQAVFDYVNDFLDQALPLAASSYKDVAEIKVELVDGKPQLSITSKEGTQLVLQDAEQFVGMTIQGETSCALFRHNKLHVELQLNAEDSIGALHPFGLKDVVLESAITTIQDCEDSVAAVDAEDKVGVYRNWLGLMKGDLSANFNKGGKTVQRNLNEDRQYTDTAGDNLTLPGRSMMLVRNVGHLMTNDAVLDQDGNEVPEGMIDAIITSLIALHDINGEKKNSREGNVYIVKPKMHGPEEVAFTVELFGRVEQVLGMAPNTLKMGIMDEERRTSANLKACIKEARERVIFINTGFLDRTGDEIHTSMEAGPMLPKAVIRQQTWIQAYEDRNVAIGLNCGFRGKAQIGKGMWAMPDQMATMMETKIGHPKSGANCAWVPSPTAATLHVMHYHQVSVEEVQRGLLGMEEAPVSDLIQIPLMSKDLIPSTETVERELDNNVQGILGYVVRWVDQGVGCSKVPDIQDVGLMEDRATLRISSQHIANWLHHGICTQEQVHASFERMAVKVDEQNAADPNYVPLAPSYNGVAYQAALELVFEGRVQPSGYTEPLLHANRYKLKNDVVAAA